MASTANTDVEDDKTAGQSHGVDDNLQAAVLVFSKVTTEFSV
jgi:hypothetical protein